MKEEAPVRTESKRTEAEEVGRRTETKTTDQIGQDNGDQENTATEPKSGTS